VACIVGGPLHIATYDRQFDWDWQGGGLMKPQSSADLAVLTVLREVKHNELRGSRHQGERQKEMRCGIQVARMKAAPSDKFQLQLVGWLRGFQVMPLTKLWPAQVRPVSWPVVS
jgi:hypothetical protein